MPTLTMPRFSAAGLGFIASLEGLRGGEPTTDRLDGEPALDRLRQDAARAELTVRLAVMVPVSQSQFDALVSFVLDVGAGNFRDSALLRKVNASDFTGATAEFAKWTRVRGEVFPALVRRRAAEASMFAGGSGWLPPGPATGVLRATDLIR